MSTQTSPQSVQPTAASDDRNATVAVTAFPLLVIAGAVIAFLAPDAIAPTLGPWVSTMLGIIIGFSYAGSVWGMLPGQEGVSWQGHLFGAIGGVVAAASGVASNKKNNKQLRAPQRGINHAR